MLDYGGSCFGRSLVLDIVFVALGFALFGVTAAYVAVCERL